MNTKEKRLQQLAIRARKLNWNANVNWDELSDAVDELLAGRSKYKIVFIKKEGVYSILFEGSSLGVHFDDKDRAQEYVRLLTLEEESKLV